MGESVTVITPCYNPGRYLLPMLESVAKQGGLVAKHIVMDGGSNDGSVDIMKTWAAEHPWFEFVSEKDNGQADACRKALERVETEYFFWLNADDVMCEGACEALLSAILQIKQSNNRSRAAGDAAEGLPIRQLPSMVYGDYLRIDGEGKVYAKRRQPSYSYWDCLHGYLTVQNVAAIFNAPMLRELGGFDTSLRFVMDYDIILKLGKVGPVKHVKAFCGAFRVHATSKTSTIDDVCRKETEALRTRYGVTTNPTIRNVLSKVAKLRAGLRMASQGCLKDRIY